MFKKIFTKEPTQAHYKSGLLVPILSAEALLKHAKHKYLLEQLVHLAQLSREANEEFYVPFLHRFAEWVQILPSRLDWALCSLLNNSLLRGINTLHRFTLSHTKPDPLECYAVFTASVLQDIAGLVVNQKIIFTDPQGMFIDYWQPFKGPMTHQNEAKHYKILPLAPFFQKETSRLTLLLAQRILPETGFLWLTSNTNALLLWLEILQNDAQGDAGRLSRAIQLFQHPTGKELGIDALPLVSVDLTESPATTHADAFLTWLREGIASNNIPINTPESSVQVTAEGVFLKKPDIFKQFIDLYVLPINNVVLYQQFGNLFGLTKMSGDDYHFDQLFGSPNTKTRMGLGYNSTFQNNQTQQFGFTIQDPALVFTTSTPPAYAKGSIIHEISQSPKPKPSG